MYATGKTEDNAYAKTRYSLCIQKLKTYSNRVIRMKADLHGKDSATVINAYASTSRAVYEKVEQFEQGE